MDARTSHDNAWTLDGTVGELVRGPLSAHIDVARPDWGLTQLRLDGGELPGHLLAIQRRTEPQTQQSTWPLPLADAYVRGLDLVAAYQPASDWPYSPQLYWSSNPFEGLGEVLGSLSLLISVETHLLDTWPRICVGSQLACRELLQIDPATGAAAILQREQSIQPATAACCVLRRLSEVPVSYVEIMPASDFRELTIRRDEAGGFRAEWQLFADFLEKGVIRKARLQSAFLPSQNDLGLALACCQATEQRPLPLTT